MILWKPNTLQYISFPLKGFISSFGTWHFGVWGDQPKEHITENSSKTLLPRALIISDFGDATKAVSSVCALKREGNQWVNWIWEIIPSSLSPSDDYEEVAIQGRQHISLDCIRDNRGSWNLIVCEKRAGRVIQSGCTKVGRIILTDGSSGRLRKEKVTNIRVGDK